MAKDKGKSKVDEKKKGKGASSDEFAKPSEAPARGDGWRLEDEKHIGDLFLITPLREETVKGFEDADTQVIVANIVHLNEKKPKKSEEHSEVYVWGRWVQGALRGYMGERRVLARLEKDPSKAKGKNAAWVLEDGDGDDVATAKAYLASVLGAAVDELKGDKKKKGKKK